MKHTKYAKAAIFTQLMASVLLGQQAVAGEQDPEKWYLKEYGSLWLAEPWNKAEEVAAFYHSSIQVHEAGEVITHDARTWIADLLVQWKSEAWLGSEVTDLQVDRLNESTTAYKARWRDYYQEADDEYSCGWYVADLMGGDWKFNQYATIDCEAHGFKHGSN